ncbi:MAG: FAD binding domain-containing protein [Elusimicrobia bacterium]|nr:FAD binding domain-containing protein [Elusimicrobiota bacterium]
MTVLRPRDAAEAVALYAARPAALPLAGGTDLLVLWTTGALNGRTVLDLSGVKEWRSIRKTVTGLSIGSLATHAELRGDPAVRREFPLLAAAAAAVGAEQIQNRGTLGGNIANASPAGDAFPALAVYEAAVVAVSRKGQRSIPFCEFFAGVKKTNLAPGELIASVVLPYLETRPRRQLFRKVGTRAAMSISKTAAAGLLWVGPDRRVRELRFALGSMAPTVRRLRAAEGLVKGKRLGRELAAEACELLRRDVSPIEDARSTAEYRLHVSQNLLADFLLGTQGSH